MEVTESLREDGISILKLAGRMDIEGTGKVELKLTVATAVDRAHVIVDLSDVTFMSSIGIGVLVRLAKTIRRRDGNLVLLNPQPIVRLVLEKTGIPGVIGLYDTMDAALAGVRTDRN